MTVLTKKNGKLSGAQWNLDHIIETEDWTLKIFAINEIKKSPFYKDLKEYDNGTIVIWKNFDRMLNGSSNLERLFDNKMEIARNHISLVFHRFRNINIYFNNEKIQYFDPFLSKNPATQALEEEIITIENEKIYVKPYILPHYSKLRKKEKKFLDEIWDLRRNQGFYIYRNKRLIIWGEWFRIIRPHELNKLARIRVDIPNTLDFLWDIDIKKSTASIPDVIRDNLKDVVERTSLRSERVYKYRGRKQNDDGLEHIWNVVDNRGKYNYLINRELPMYKKILDSLDSEGKIYFESFLKVIENSFPFEDIYYRKSKNSDSVSNKNLSEDEVYEIGLSIIKAQEIFCSDKETLLEQLHRYDFFKDYPEVVKKLREENGFE